MSPDKIARDFPEAVALARAFRDAFGPGVRLLRATNNRGQVLGRGEFQDFHPVTVPLETKEPRSPARSVRERDEASASFL